MFEDQYISSLIFFTNNLSASKFKGYNRIQKANGLWSIKNPIITATA